MLLVSLEIPLETAIRALRRGWDAGMFTILNPAPAPSLSEPEVRELLTGAMAITPNRVEALALAGMTPDAQAEPDWTACGFRLKEMGPACVVITLGARGCHVIDAKSHAIPAPRVEAVDTVGAGDAFNGALAAALAASGPSDLYNAAAWANAAAALAVTQPGAQSALPYRDAIDRLARRERIRHEQEWYVERSGTNAADLSASPSTRPSPTGAREIETATRDREEPTMSPTARISIRAG